MPTRVKRPATKKNAAMSRALGTVIAERTLTLVAHADALVRIRMGKPRKERATGDYFCPFSIEGIGERKLREARGIDSMQALQNALQAIRLELAPHLGSLSWEGGQDGGLGFPKAVPDLFGPKFTQRLEGIVDREVDRFARSLERTNQHTETRPVSSRKRISKIRR
jgi:hypothetical protein